MAATSLAEQLKALAVPQATIYKDEKKTASLLFDPKEAALKDLETFYQIGLSGLTELIALQSGFKDFEKSLFSIASKDFERAVQSKEVNQNLSENIERFLLQLSPYLLIQSAHKALEWLVHRFHIHQYNQDAVITLILPYHETKIFVRFVQLLSIKNPNNRWHWLLPIQKTGTPLAKQVLYNQCASNPATLKFITNRTLKYVEEFGERSSQLNTIFAFLCSATIGTIDTIKRVNEAIINALLPTMIKGLVSPHKDFRASAYVILGYLCSKTSLKEETINQIMDKLFNADLDLTYDVVLLINLIYTTQTHISKISDEILHNISPDTMNDLCVHLKTVLSYKINAQIFVEKFLQTILPIIQHDSEDLRRFAQLVEILVDEVDFKMLKPKELIRCIIDSYVPNLPEQSTDDSGSDIEIIDDENFSASITEWYSKLLKSLEQKYPTEFDKVIMQKLSPKNNISDKTRGKLSELLGFKPAISHKVGNTTLFENLHHVNPEFRIEAVKYIANNFKTIQEQNVDFLKDAIINRFNDDDPEVVAATLNIPTEYLNDILTDVDLGNVFVKIVARDLRNFRRWRRVVHNTIVKLCALDALPVTHETLLAVFPHLFPYDKNTASLTFNIMTSVWGKKCYFIKSIKGLSKVLAEDNPDLLGHTAFNFVCAERAESSTVLDINKLNKANTLDVCSYLLLLSGSYKSMSLNEITQILDLLLELVAEREILTGTDSEKFDYLGMSEFINFARQDKIQFQFMEYIFGKIIEGLPVKEIQKPWCNFCESPSLVLIRRLYEICVTGCYIPTYNVNYAKLLDKLFKKYCKDTKEKVQFVLNFACGHILYAHDPKEVIGPELQLKSLKLWFNLIVCHDDTNWMTSSEMVHTTLLFNLNNPLPAIRQFTLNIIQKLLEKNDNNDNPNHKMLVEIMKRKEELLMDHEQLPQVIHSLLTQAQANPKTKHIQKQYMNFLLTHAKMSPPHITLGLLHVFSQFKSSGAMSTILQNLSRVHSELKSNPHPNFSFDIYQSRIITNILDRLTAESVSCFYNVWEPFMSLLRECRECVLQEDNTYTSPSVLVLKRIDESIFDKLSVENASSLVYETCKVGAFSAKPNCSSAASKTMKKVHLKFVHFKAILENMLKVEDPGANPKAKKNVPTFSHALSETQEWKIGVTLLEYVQSKKKMTVDNKFVSLLFQVLKRCLRFEEQSYVEYTKQLILSSLWYYCKKMDDANKEQVASLKSVFDIELVVQCIGNTQNPQTHHHALIVLSHAAYMLPEQVLHHTMEIFTFMGTSVLRHDDAYSFQIIMKIIETLIPILVKMDKNIEDYSAKELQLLQDRIVPVLRIFADVVLHVPEHRRLPLYKKLIETIGPNKFLWVFLALLIETHIAHFNEGKEKEKRPTRTLADQESPVNRMDFGQSILLEFPPEICIENFMRLINYVKSLPLQKDEDSMETDINPSEIFSVNGHTAVQLRHYKYALITFMNTCLASSRFIQHANQATNVTVMEEQYKAYIINVLTYIQTISKINDEKTAKYWRVMLHHSYDLLDHTNNLLTVNMFLSVVRGLMSHTLQTVRRKAMELLNSKMQFNPEFFEGSDRTLLFSLLPALLDVVKTIDSPVEDQSETALQELELNQQTALLSLKLLTRMIAAENPEEFQPVLETITNYTCDQNISGNVMASVVLCLAELCSNMKAHALASLRKFMPALIKVLKKQRQSETPELILLSTVTAVAKVVESLPLFLSPYLQKILFEYSILLAKWQGYDQECAKVSAIVAKLQNIKKKIATCIPPRVLIPVVSETHDALLEKENFDAIGPLMAILAESFTNVTPADFATLQNDLTSFFISALQLRSNAVEKQLDNEVIKRTEDEIVKALVCLVLKLSEGSFRPLYHKVYDWAIRANEEHNKERTITFYRLSSAIAEKLKGLFVLFSSHFIKNAAEMLDACNNSKTEELFFDNDTKCMELIEYILRTLNTVFLYDSQNFMSKEMFETLMQSVVDQLENTVGGIINLKTRAKEVLIPCIAQFAVAIGDDSLWKLLNYQILLKTRHNDAEIRLTSLDCLVAMATQLGSSWLPLLAESVPFLAELLEDGDQRIETSTKESIRKLEQILGEPLEKYF